MDLQISKKQHRYHQVRKTAQHSSMLPCKAVISKYLIYAQLPSHEPQHFAFRTQLWQRNLTQCTDLGTSSPHRQCSHWKWEQERRGCPVWWHHQSFGEWRFLLLLGDIIITKPMESAEGLEGSSGVYVNCVSHFWQDPDHEQVTLKCKIIFLIYFLQHHKPHCMNNSPTSGL